MKLGSYESVANKYERLDLLSNIICFGSLYRLRMKLLDRIEADEKLLDIGCGTGRFAIECAKKGVDVTALDISPTMIKIAKKNAKKAGVEKNIGFICADTSKAGIEERFDVVTLVYVIDVIPTYKECVKIIKCAKKWLKPGGRIIIADETIPKSALLRSLILPFVRWPFFRVLSLVTSNKYRKVFDVEKMYAKAGLVRIKTHGNPFQYLALIEGYKKE